MVGQTKEVPTKPEEPAKKVVGRRASDVPTFPRHSLSMALKLAQSIETNNAGRPYDKITLAKSLDMSPNSSGYRNLITSSSRYGLTEGGYQAEKIALTALGSSIVAPTSDSQKNQGIKQAMLNPDLFRKIFAYYDNKQIPREELFKNALKKEFQVLPEDVDVCYDIVIQNMRDFNMIEEVKGNQYLQINKLSSTQVISPESTQQESAETAVVEQEESEKPSSMETKREVIPVPKVFISHSKNQNILEQIKDMLEFGNFEYIIAEEEETSAIPIPDKVFGLMRECNCAIINVSADDENKRDDGAYRINENVLIEIGGAFVHYNKRVILLVDKRIVLPSNLQGLYRCEYEGDELLWNVAMKLQKVLADFRKSL